MGVGQRNDDGSQFARRHLRMYSKWKVFLAINHEIQALERREQEAAAQKAADAAKARNAKRNAKKRAAKKRLAAERRAAKQALSA